MTKATTASQASAPAQTRVPFRVKVHHIECCNCNHGCNCQFGGFPDHGGCEAMIGGEVYEGSYGEVPMAGVRFIIGVMYPGAIHEGRGNVVLFVDEKAKPKQAEAITKILTGQAGGMPWEAIAATVASLEGPVRKPIELKVDGTRSSYRIPGVLEMQQTPIRDAVSGQEKEIQIVYPKGGFMWDRGNICTTAAMELDYGKVRFKHPGGFASYATATWTNQQ